MPYQENKDLPPEVKNHLPPHAQDIYRQAFNHAWDEYADPKKRRLRGSREDTARRVAWAAVKKLYYKADGHWESYRLAERVSLK